MDDVADDLYPLPMIVFDTLMGYTPWFNASKVCSFPFPDDAATPKPTKNTPKR
jgi:hypothetical protein